MLGRLDRAEAALEEHGLIVKEKPEAPPAPPPAPRDEIEIQLEEKLDPPQDEAA